MLAYWLIFFFLFILCLMLPTYNSKMISGRSYIMIVLISMLVLILFAGLRKVSNDYSGYEAIFNKVPQLDHLTSKLSNAKNAGAEMGFVLIISILKLFSDNVVIIMLFASFWAVLLNIYSFERMSPYLFLSIILYFVHNFLLKETVQVRQGLASAIIMFGLVQYHRKLRFVGLIIVAAFIQSSALAAIIPLVFHNISKKLSKKYYIYLLGFVFAFSIIFPVRKLLNLALETVGLPGALSGYIGYSSFDYDLGFLNPMFIKQITLFFILLSFKETLQQKFSYFTILFNFYFCGILWYIYFSDFAILAGRVSNLFVMGEVILIPMLISITVSKEKIVFYLAVVFYAAINLFLNLKGQSIFPYQNILF